MSLTLAVGETDSQSLSFGLTLTDISSGVPHPATVAANIGGQFHIRNNYQGQHCILQ